jgi:hypothetical protein
MTMVFRGLGMPLNLTWLFGRLIYVWKFRQAYCSSAQAGDPLSIEGFDDILMDDLRGTAELETPQRDEEDGCKEVLVA